ncbi:MAG: hypothetical protein ACM3ZQ_01460 [Bacillota bacterium]
MLLAFVLGSVVGFWAWNMLLPHRRCDSIPTPSELSDTMRRVAVVDLLSLSLIFAMYRARAVMAVLAWLFVRFGGVYALYRYGWYWLANWASSTGGGDRGTS